MANLKLLTLATDTVGAEMTGRLAKYHVADYLGEGVTSRVYHAFNAETGAPVALKVLRENVSDELASHFWRERTVLAELAWAERATSDGLANIPRLIDWQENGPERFLALELVTGIPLDRLLDSSETGWLPELDAIDIADQVLRVLNLLHIHTRRTYTDLQMQNICCEKGNAGGGYQVKVLDWNHVSDKIPEGETMPKGFGAGDLARFAAYLYRMLTGKGANEQGESERELRKRVGKRWDDVSLFARRLVVRGLHPRAAQRFTTASEFREAVRGLRDYWQRDWVDLLSEVKPALATLNLRPEGSGAETEQLKGVLDLATRLGAHRETVERYRSQLDANTADVSPDWHAGQRYFQAGQYHTAVEKWRPEAEAFGCSALWRQLLLAEAGAELGPRVFALWRADLQGSVSALNEDQPGDALEALERAYGGSGRCEAVGLLHDEAWARMAVRAAGQKSLAPTPEEAREAARLYCEADSLLRKLPYGRVLSSELEWPDLQGAAKALDEYLRRSERDKERAKALSRALEQDLDQGLHQLEVALRERPVDAAIFELALDQADQLTKSRRSRAAIRLLELVTLYGNFEQDTESGNRIHESLVAARAMAKTEEERTRVLERISSDAGVTVAKGWYAQARRELAELGSTELADLQTLLPLRHVLEDRLDGALDAGEQPVPDLVALLDLLDPEPQRVAERKLRCEQLAAEQLALQIQQAVDVSLWPQALALCTQLPPDTTRRNERLRALTTSLTERFESAANNMNFQGVSTLLPVLALLDPDDARMVARLRRRDAVRQQLLRDHRQWLAGLLRRHETRKPDSLKALQDAIKEIEVSQLIIEGEPTLAEWGERLGEMRVEYERVCEELVGAAADKIDEHAEAAQRHLEALVTAYWQQVDANLKKASDCHQGESDAAAARQTDYSAAARHFFSSLQASASKQHLAMIVSWDNIGGSPFCEGLLVTDERVIVQPTEDRLLAWLNQTVFTLSRRDASERTGEEMDNVTNRLLQRTLTLLICLRLLATVGPQIGQVNGITPLYGSKTSGLDAASWLRWKLAQSAPCP